MCVMGEPVSEQQSEQQVSSLVLFLMISYPHNLSTYRYFYPYPYPYHYPPSCVYFHRAFVLDGGVWLFDVRKYVLFSEKSDET